MTGIGPALAWETAFVRARRCDLHPVLAAPERYGRWWPGVRTAELGGDVTELRLGSPGRRWRREQRLRLRVERLRDDLGVHLRVEGAFTGEAQWYYLDEPAGVTVAYLLHGVTARRGSARRIRQHRTGVWRALNALKDGLERGRAVGAEPERHLLVDQVAARAAYEAQAAPDRCPTAATTDRAG